ncbi:hypothetical protein QBC42DRAFT_334068 [Cladorrhinum samala]|uniref:Secreted protein n=1 Tax=Cladorrhinum samala TaxID=585594 RepID=A0AAV9HI27_9PEZI|nr:hypothetical protein QBC42DRAFT_334068 [Cladorrhinum samala]
MLALTPLQTLILTLGAAASAQQLAIIETNPTFFSGRDCYDGASTYAIIDFGAQHAPYSASNCTPRGNVLSTAGGLDVSCANGRWSNGWKVCQGFGVVAVHNGRGQYQACVADDTTIFNCPVAISCWTNKVRKWKCTGSWIQA